MNIICPQGSLPIHSVRKLYCCHLCYCLPTVVTIMHCCWPSFSRHTPWCHTETCGNLFYETKCAAYVFTSNKLYVPPISRDNVIGFHVFCQVAFTPSRTYTPLIPDGHKFCSNLPSIFVSYVTMYYMMRLECCKHHQIYVFLITDSMHIFHIFTSVTSWWRTWTFKTPSQSLVTWNMNTIHCLYPAHGVIIQNL